MRSRWSKHLSRRSKKTRFYQNRSDKKKKKYRRGGVCAWGREGRRGSSIPKSQNAINMAIRNQRRRPRTVCPLQLCVGASAMQSTFYFYTRTLECAVDRNLHTNCTIRRRKLGLGVGDTAATASEGATHCKNPGVNIYINGAMRGRCGEGEGLI